MSLNKAFMLIDSFLE